MNVLLSIGDHTIELKLAGYATLTMIVNVSADWVVTCKSVTGGACGSTTPPGAVLSGLTITGYLKAAAVTTYDQWVSSKGGAAALKGNLIALGEIIDGYIGIIQLGYTVTIGNVGTTINYYLGV